MSESASDSFSKLIGSIESVRYSSKVILAVALFIAVFFIYKIVLSWALKNISSNELRYRTQKRIRFASFVIFVLLGLSFWSSEIRNLTLLLGFAGAGVAFALQEVIVSIAGWVAVITGRFYSHGDRVQLGGIFGDVLDIGVLRTTIMECGQWVHGDQI